MKKAISRIDYFSGVLPDEYDLIKAGTYNTYFMAKPVTFNYFSLNKLYDDSALNDPYVEGFNIQVGNSGDFSNNHADVLKILFESGVLNKKIYIPLSYAGPDWYCQEIVKVGNDLFGERFQPLLNYLSIDDYYNILNSTRYSIFYHERQQAMGNIFQAMWRGCLVFLSENNPVYVHLKNRGYCVYTVQHDLYKIKNSEVLSENIIRQNRKLLIEDYSIKTIKKQAEDLINILRASIKS